MKKVKLCLDHTKYRTKPEGAEIGRLSGRIAQSDRIFALSNTDDFRMFAEMVGKNGVTFSPATYHNESRSIDNFEQMHLLVLDFDDGISYAEVMDRNLKYDLPAVMAYETLSSVGQNRFRVIYKNNTPITDKRLAKITLDALHTIFPESDKQCNDISRMYFGGKKLLYFDESLPTVDPESILRNMTFYLKTKRKANHCKEHVEKFAKKNGIKLTNTGLLNISVSKSATEYPGTIQNGKISQSAILLIKDHGENFPNSFYYLNFVDGCTKTSVAKNRSKNHNEFLSKLLPKLSNRCRLYKEFASGERWLVHDELFGISTNITHVETGIKTFKEILKKYPDYYSQKIEQFDFYLKYNKENEYSPERCEFFCPYKDTCKHSKNILLTVAPKRGIMERVTNFVETFYSIDEVHAHLREILLQAIESCEEIWHIIKAQTAAGKTEAYLELMTTTGLRFLIVVPTNMLKQDVGVRANEKGLEFIITPSLDEIKHEMPAHVWKHICHLRETGQHKKVHTFVTRMAEEENIKCLQKHLNQQKEYEEHDGHAITTHRRFLNMSEKALSKYDVVIIDEDIILNSIASNQCEIPISTLKKMLKMASTSSHKHPSYSKLIFKIKRILKAIKTKRMFMVTPFEWDDDTDDFDEKNEEVDGISALTDIPSFCWSEHFLYRKASEEKNLKEDCIVFLKPWKFKNIKHIMVSATVDKDICEYVFGKHNTKFYECKRAAYKGTLNQYHSLSMSRSCIDNHEGILDEIRAWSGFLHMITFKKYGIGDSYFGNAIGCDHLKGQNINVVGTPYQVDFLYKLLPFTLGIPIDGEAKMKNCKITHNGYICNFKTFGEEHEVLRKFQLWMIESDLEQAVGRARLLRCDCTVNLFSNFPLRQANMKDSDFLCS